MVNVVYIWKTDFKDIQAYIETDKGSFVASYEDKTLAELTGLDTESLYDLIEDNKLELLKRTFLRLVKEDIEIYLDLPKLSKCSNLLQKLFESTLASDSGMFFYEYDDWKEDGRTKEELDVLKKEIKRYGLQDIIRIQEDDCVITSYADLITRFINDRGCNDE